MRGIALEWAGESEIAVEGDKSIKVPFNGKDWGGVYFMFDSFDAGSAGKLGMSLRLPKNTASLELKAEGPSTVTGTVNILDYRVGEKVNGWVDFVVPLNAFKGVDSSRLSVMGLWNPRNAGGAYVTGDLLVDDIHFE